MRLPPNYASLPRWMLAATPGLECCLVRSGQCGALALVSPSLPVLLDVTNALRRLGIMVFKVRTCVLACDAQCADTKHVCRPISTQRACLASRFRRFTAFCSPTPTASQSTILSFVTES